jgi:hypothetical protein
VAVACGFFVHEGQYRVFLLRPEVAGFHELSPYYFTTNALFESEITYDASQRPGQRRNVAEWQAYVGVAVPLKDIEEALYGLDPMTFWDDFDRLRNENAFVKHLAERDTLALAYLRYARRCEKLVNYDDPWRLDGWDMDGIARAQAFGHALWAKAPSDFLKGRIGYQLIRLEYYGGWLSADTLQALYSKRVMPYAKTSWIDASARYYVAERMADGPVRLYALSRVFDEGLDKRSRIVSLFPKDSLDAILALARTDHERAVIAVLSAIHRRGRALKQLEGIQSLDPTNSFLPFLLVREVNKVEDWLMTPVLTEYLPASRSEWWSLKYDEPRPPQIARSVDLAYAQELHRFLHTALKDCAPEQRATLELIAAHLSFVTGNLDDAEEHLAQAEGLPVKQRSHLAAQLAMERVLLHFARTPKLDAAIEQAIMTVDRALDTGDDVLAGRVMRDQLHLYIARRLMENGDVARGIYMLSHTDRAYGDTYWNTKTPYLELLEKGSPADIDRMIALLDKPHKTPFESWLTGGKVWQATRETARLQEHVVREPRPPGRSYRHPRTGARQFLDDLPLHALREGRPVPRERERPAQRCEAGPALLLQAYLPGRDPSAETRGGDRPGEGRVGQLPARQRLFQHELARQVLDHVRCGVEQRRGDLHRWEERRVQGALLRPGTCETLLPEGDAAGEGPGIEGAGVLHGRVLRPPARPAGSASAQPAAERAAQGTRT